MISFCGKYEVVIHVYNKRPTLIFAIFKIAFWGLFTWPIYRVTFWTFWTEYAHHCMRTLGDYSVWLSEIIPKLNFENCGGKCWSLTRYIKFLHFQTVYIIFIRSGQSFFKFFNIFAINMFKISWYVNNKFNLSYFFENYLWNLPVSDDPAAFMFP